MIVVVGTPAVRVGERGVSLAGVPALTAAAAARAGADVQLVGRAGEDPEGDVLAIALARERVGHAALLRDAAVRTPAVGDRPAADERFEPTGDGLAEDEPVPEPGWLPLEAADVELGLRYLTDFRVVVVAEPQPPDAIRAAADAAGYANARLVIVARDEAAVPDDAIVLLAPESDPGGAFAAFLGAYAAALDSGADPKAALGDVSGRVGWERAGTG